MKNGKFCRLLIVLLGIAALTCGCGEEKDMDDTNKTTPTVTSTATPTPTATPTLSVAEKWSKVFAEMKPASTLKQPNCNNPLMVQRLGADPYALVYDGRVYIYMTGDVIETQGSKPLANSYQKINTINVISSDDFVNWTDHGSIKAAGYSGAAKWGGNSWAPAAACKEIDGKMQFFLYFANSGNGIGVLRADNPWGPLRIRSARRLSTAIRRTARMSRGFSTRQFLWMRTVPRTSMSAAVCPAATSLRLTRSSIPARRAWSSSAMT